MIFRFEGFRYALFFGKLFYQPRKHCFCPLIEFCKVISDLSLINFYSLNLKNNRSCTVITASNHSPTFIIYKYHLNVFIFEYSD